MATRQFEDRPAVREATPLLLGLVGPSGSGKTFSALRLATGIQKVVGGDIWGIDTEARRMLHYADRFKFRHLPFGAPFSPLDYLAAVEHCVSRGARIVVVDSMSHEHEGPGGILEMHADEVQRLMKAWGKSEDVVKMSAWQKPKAARRRLINTLLQMPVHFVFCFRAKEKLKIVKGKDPEELGFMPIAGEEFVYEMVAKFLLLPGAIGFPAWTSAFSGERAMIKIPEQFRELLQGKLQLSEDVGQKLAQWAAGAPAAKPAANPVEILARYAACSDPATLRALEDERRACWTSCTKEQKEALKAAADATAARLRDAVTPAATSGEAEAPRSMTPAEEEEFNRGFVGAAS